MPLIVSKIIITVIRNGDDLLVKMPDGETAKVFALSQDHFFFSFKGVGEYQARVIRNDEGKVKGILRKIGFRELMLEKID